MTVQSTPLSSAPDLPFQYVGGNPAVDLVNTVDWTSRGLKDERLTDYGRLTRWAEGVGILSTQAAGALRVRAEARPHDAEAALRLALRVREVLKRLLGALARNESPGDTLGDFNGFLGRALDEMRVIASETRNGHPLELGWHGLGESLDSIVWPVVWSAASLIVSEEAAQIRICGGTDCGWMYVDRSRNKLRRWCQMETCGTREKSRRRHLSLRSG